ncbi:poly-beta-hydroxybutyrate polymerase N-terminal domain-containing protein [Roseobacter ponti]|uniref:poly-beta-hydroxybutyrate polymerase N-terminal domain-containing protein n=1 Tax=Roseobacter ponti TaxID=1891787 RepID=UPI00197FA9C6|nr:poly-beta-hydroxybutyrate polymerase N-terminal domain-containing protein [Roseobacter ponti]
MTDSERKRLDPAWHAMLGQVAGGISPAALINAGVDRALHLAASPDKQSELLGEDLSGLAATDPSGDARFSDPAWTTFPAKALAQG